MDVIYVVDVSKRSSTDDVSRLRSFLEKQIEELNVSSETARVGVILLGKSEDEVLTLDEGNDKIKVKSFVLGITKGTENSDIFAALQKLSSGELASLKRNVPQVVVILAKNAGEQLNKDRTQKEIERLSNGENKVIVVNISPDAESESDGDLSPVNTLNIKGTRYLPSVYPSIYEDLAKAAGLYCVFY